MRTRRVDRRGPDWSFWGLGSLLLFAFFALGSWFMIGMPGTSFQGTPPPPSPTEEKIRDHLQEHVARLAGHIGERNLWNPSALDDAAGYIEGRFVALGVEVRRQTYRVMDRQAANLVVDIPGRDPGAGILLLGAHYDSVRGSAGANDNASGVAVLLELARLLSGSHPRHTVRFAAFVNEEPPFFQTDRMGSQVYLLEALANGERFSAMLSLETLGYYSDAPGSQHYPSPAFRLFYPERGNFVAFVGNLASRTLVRRVTGQFRSETPFPSEGLAAPSWVAGVDWSDQWSFWQAGIPALMVTDTAPYRYPHYHLPSDTPDRLDYPSLARVTVGLARVVGELAGISAPELPEPALSKGKAAP